MASGKQVEAGGAFIKIWTDKNPLEKGLKDASATLKRWGAGISSVGKTIGAIGAAIVAPLTAAAKLSAEAGAKLYDMSKRTGISVEKLSALSYAADVSGTSLEGVEIAVKRMQKSIGGVADELEGTTGKLDDLGISAEQIRGLAPDKQFELIISKLRLIKDPTERAAKAMQVFGRSGTDILPLVDNLDQLTDRAAALGFIRSSESAKSAKEFSVAMIDAGRAVKSLWGALAGPIIPLLKQKTEQLMAVTLAARDWAKANAGIIVLAFEVGFALTVAGAGLLALGQALKYTAIAGKALAVVMGALTSPIAIVATLAGLLLYTSGVGKQALDFLREQFGWLSEDAGVAMRGVTDALKGGNVKLAAQILWKFLEIGWIQFKATANGIVNAISDSIVGAWIEMTAQLQTAWVKFKDWFKRFTTDLGDDFVKLNVQLALKGAQTELKSREKNPAAYDASNNEQKKAELRKSIDEYKAQLRNVDQINGAAHAQLSEEAQQQLDAINKEKAQAMKDLGHIANTRDQDALAQKQKEIAELEKQLQALAGQAASGAGNRSKEAPGGSGPPADVAPSSLRASEVRGSFNYQALTALTGGRGPAEQTAANTKKTADNTKQLYDGFITGQFDLGLQII